MQKIPWSSFSFLLLAIIFTHCSTPPKEGATDNAKVLLNKIDTEYVKISDLRIAQLKEAEKVFGPAENKKFSDAVRQYEASGVDVSKKASVYWDVFSNDDDPKLQRALAMADAAMARAEARAERQGGIVPAFNISVADRNFDLALQENDFAIQQVKTLNNYFGDAGKETLDAIAYYEKLSKDEKVKMMSSRVGYTPVPDFQQNIYWQLQRGYVLQKLLLQQQLNRYLRYRLNRYINEFPQGYKTTSLNTSGGDYNDKMFDLKKAAMNARH